MPPDPQALLQRLQQLQSQPTWEDVRELISRDGPRGFRIDIETDSTVAADIQSEQQGMAELLGGVTQFISSVGPAVQMGFIPVEAAKAILMAAVRRFRMGKQVEDALDQIGDKPMAPAPQGAGGKQPDPMANAIAAQKIQNEDRQHAEELQFQQQKAAGEQQNESAKIETDAQLKKYEIDQKTSVEMARIASEERRHIASLNQPQPTA